jgi:hypothetical protein
MSVFQFSQPSENISLQNQSGIKKIDSGFFILFFINLGLIIFLTALNSYIDTGVLDSDRFKLSDFKKGFFIFFVIAVFIFPFFEELIHRSYVSKRKNALWSIIFIIIYFFLISDYSFYRILVFSLYIIFVISVKYSKKLYKNKIYLMVFTTLFFAFFHIFKFEDFQNYPLMILLISLFPQFITGVILFFIHNRYGFLAGVLHHGLLNGILLLIIYISVLLFEQEMSASLIAD